MDDLVSVREAREDLVTTMILRMARETGWDYARTLGDLKKTGIMGRSPPPSNKSS